MGCDGSSSCSMTSGCFSCNLQQWNEQPLLNKLMNEQGLPRNSNAVYAIIAGTNVRYQMSQTNQVMGESGLCGKSKINNIQLQAYTILLYGIKIKVILMVTLICS